MTVEEKTPEERLMFHMGALPQDQRVRLVAEHSVQVLESVEAVMEAIDNGRLPDVEHLAAVRTLISEARYRAAP